ncbi:oligoribonuclease, mitochondrial isoform X4 [Coccinella septempunctata]|uniref:oligoribonuclease, mitochondrial isoform X4 n=2 Tax=Coccinella septempunctata TaxID=41139 RepID=UPI001D064CD0|nr:oligoribonuclease, mitochondrial isoform X4 [Coccinella septempunctata]XP_044756087.1 oligoribonuclease, mitochondrial isoform X4 [Coccinella septempunctata]
MLKLVGRLNLLELGKCGTTCWRRFLSKSEMTTPIPNLDLGMERIVWIDMEMTGLDIEKDKIMEVACLVTDSQLNIIAEGPDLVINQPKNILDNMNEWCKIQHGKTGLTEACLASSISIAEAEKKLLDFVKEYTTPKSCPLGGNSVYMDRLFLRKFMKNVDEHLHYRIIDVSTVKELCRRWNLEIYKSQPKKGFSHRASDDIKESIEELKFYKEHFFKILQN